ncbi:MAG: hypothetical protein KW804_00220 [Candidatus Doudnabacteria bacterium]|nr:hypothetical protein [Candidatus Doudnabacteria bacterium]
MRKIAVFLSLLLLAGSSSALAAVTVNTTPSSLVTSPTTLATSSGKAIFEFALTADAGETLSSVGVTVNSSNAVAGDFASVAVYRDDGDGVFDAGDTTAGSNTTVNVGSTTTINTAANNTLTGAKFFVVLNTSSTWTGSDSATVTLNANGITTSTNSPTSPIVTTSTLTVADTTAPALLTVLAMNKTGGTSAKEAGDTVVLTFGEATTKPTITAANIDSVLVLNNSHSWLDGVSSIGGSAWNADGTVLTITLSAGSSAPTISVGDTVTVSGSVIKDSSGNNAVGSRAITGSFGPVDSTGPVLLSATAMNKTGGTSAKEAGDTVVLTFGEATNKPAITSANINSVLVLNNSHSWLDGASAIGSATWNDVGTILTVTLSAGTSLPTLAVGDTVTVTGTTIKDAAGNNATGSKAITGSFGTTTTPPADGDDDDDDFGKHCDGIINGKLYKIGTNPTVYLAAGCRLKPFRGAAVFHARGHKFQDIITLPATPPTLNEVSTDPALPAGGTLIKGSDSTVWFVTNKGKRKGFVSATAFTRLGFQFNAVKVIANTDLATMPVDTAVTESSEHPEGSIIKCTNAPTIFEVKSGKKSGFTNPDGFLNRGHGWDVVVIVDCANFQYLSGSNLE